MSKTEAISVDLLRVDGGTQSRIAINEEVVEDYVELISASDGEWPLGTLDVFHDGNDYLVADGFHRTLAAQQSKRSSVPCHVHKGTATDARIFGMTANDRHGLRMSRADKRACVEWLLDNGGKMTQKAIAEAAGVTQRTVRSIVADRNAVEMPPSNSSRKISATQLGGTDDQVDAGEDVITESPESDDPAEEEFPEDETLEEMCERETSEIESWARQIAKLMKDAQEALKDVPTLDHLNARGGWERSLQGALSTLRFTKPVVCPMCQGEGDKTCPCKGNGRVTKQQYGQMV